MRGKSFFRMTIVVFGIVTLGCAGPKPEKHTPHPDVIYSQSEREQKEKMRIWGGSQNLEPRLIGKDILFFEDFEDPNYKQKWPVYWDPPVGAGTVNTPARYVFAGSRSAFLQSKKGKHASKGKGEYVPETPIDDVAYMRLYLRLQDDFSMGFSNELKLFGIRGDAELENTYGGAGKMPTGFDSFSVNLVIDNWRELRLYYSHLDQRGGWGSYAYCQKFFCSPKLSPGNWYCLELMLKPNTPDQRNGQIKAWLDGRLIIKVDKLRFRKVDRVKIRRMTIINYWGGGGPRNTSPKDQRIYIDNFVVSREPIGCLDHNL